MKKKEVQRKTTQATKASCNEMKKHYLSSYTGMIKKQTKNSAFTFWKMHRICKPRRDGERAKKKDVHSAMHTAALQQPV